MVIIGAGGHAKEIISLLPQNKQLCVFDDTSASLDGFFKSYRRISSEREAQKAFATDAEFILAVGQPRARYTLCRKMKRWGGVLTSFVAPSAEIGKRGVLLEEGVNVMQAVVVTADVTIGEGSLINTGASIHHDSTIGKYCEVGPGVRILGRVHIGDFSFVGAGSVVLPGIRIGQNVTIGAGSVVTKDVADHSVVWGNPAQLQRRNEPFSL